MILISNTPMGIWGGLFIFLFICAILWNIYMLYVQHKIRKLNPQFTLIGKVFDFENSFKISLNIIIGVVLLKFFKKEWRDELLNKMFDLEKARLYDDGSLKAEMRRVSFILMLLFTLFIILLVTLPFFFAAEATLMVLGYI